MYGLLVLQVRPVVSFCFTNPKLTCQNVVFSAFTDNHTVLGLVISILFSIQVVFGYIAHRTDNASNSTTRFPTLARGKGVMRYLHMAFGISIIGKWSCLAFPPPSYGCTKRKCLIRSTKLEKLVEWS